MKNLSFKYDWKFIKKLGFFVNALLIIISIAFLVLIITIDFVNITGNKKVFTIPFMLCFIVYFIFSFYYLLISLDVKYNESDLFIKIEGKWEKIPIKNVLEIKRTFYFHYTIFLKRNNIIQKDKVVYYISPNPNPWRDKNVKEVLKFAEHTINREQNEKK